MKNWAGNQRFTHTSFHEPSNLDQLIEIIQHSDKLRALGTGHSFNEIANCPSGSMVSLRNLNRIIHLDGNGLNPTITFEAGVTYGQLAEYLSKQGYALKNMASLPHISVAGAIATATHGSGDLNGCLSTDVVALKLATPQGLQELSRETIGEKFDGVVVALGALGVVGQITLKIVPRFDVRQQVFLDANWLEVRDDFDAIMGSSYSVSLFTDWQNDRINQIWFKQTSQELNWSNRFIYMSPALHRVHPLANGSPDACTEQLGIVGPWHERLPHFRMEFNPSYGDELQSELIVPRWYAVEAIDHVFASSSKIAPWILSSEIRSVAEDNLWMSPFYQRPSIGIHFTWKNNWTEVKKAISVIENKLEPFGARPHWGKLFLMEPAKLQEHYPRLDEFRSLVSQFDPSVKYRNPFIEHAIY